MKKSNYLVHCKVVKPLIFVKQVAFYSKRINTREREGVSVKPASADRHATGHGVQAQELDSKMRPVYGGR